MNFGRLSIGFIEEAVIDLDIFVVVGSCRYSREESFTTLNIDIRNHSNLLDSLEQYVKGDLLEGANAYHCEKCSKKVDTVKRMCIKKLPPILAIQLKRFDYDWERECAVKFNDHFEFPRELDMGPYTVSGLAKIEGEQMYTNICVVFYVLRSWQNSNSGFCSLNARVECFLQKEMESTSV